MMILDWGVHGLPGNLDHTTKLELIKMGAKIDKLRSELKNLLQEHKRGESKEKQ